MISHDATGHAEEPQAVLGRSRYRVKPAPRDGEHLRDYVAGVSFADSPKDVTGQRLTVGGVEVLESPHLSGTWTTAIYHATGLLSPRSYMAAPTPKPSCRP